MGVEKPMSCPTYIEKELKKRLKETSHLPDTNFKKYKVGTVRDFNQSVRRIRENGQFTITAMLDGKSEDSDSDFCPEIKKKEKN